MEGLLEPLLPLELDPIACADVHVTLFKLGPYSAPNPLQSLQYCHSHHYKAR